MRSFKSLIQLAVLLALAIAAFPIYRGHASISPAATTSTLCVQTSSGCPANVEGVPGQSFSVALQLSNVQWLISYSVTLNYNQTILAATSVKQGNWAAGPCESSGLVVPCTVFTISNTTTGATGTIQVSQALLGSSTNITSSSLIVVGFSFIAFSTSSTNPIAVSTILLGGLINGQPPVTLLPAPVVTNGNAFTPPPASAALIKSKIAPEFHKLSISRSGDVQTLTALVANEGTGTAFVRVDFTIVGADGSVSFVSTGVLAMPVGTTGTLSVSYNVPLLPNKYFVVGNLEVSGDGVLFVFSGSSKTFSYSVSP